jgi:hypothetical protein
MEVPMGTMQREATEEVGLTQRVEIPIFQHKVSYRQEAGKYLGPLLPPFLEETYKSTGTIGSG